MPTSISHLGGRARVNEPGRYRKKNNKNLMAQGLPTYVGMPQPLRNLIAKRVKPSQQQFKKRTTTTTTTTNVAVLPVCVNAGEVDVANTITNLTYNNDGSETSIDVVFSRRYIARKYEHFPILIQIYVIVRQQILYGLDYMV